MLRGWNHVFFGVGSTGGCLQVVLLQASDSQSSACGLFLETRNLQAVPIFIRDEFECAFILWSCGESIAQRKCR